MWTEASRIQHAPREERYPSALTDAEWAIVEPTIPPPRRGGRPLETSMREVMNAVRYVLRTGCQWRQLPKDFPPLDGLQLLLDLDTLQRARPHPPCAARQAARGGGP